MEPPSVRDEKDIGDVTKLGMPRSRGGEALQQPERVAPAEKRLHKIIETMPFSQIVLQNVSPAVPVSYFVNGPRAPGSDERNRSVGIPQGKELFENSFRVLVLIRKKNLPSVYSAAINHDFDAFEKLICPKTPPAVEI